jgi:hypothetical protein
MRVLRHAAAGIVAAASVALAVSAVVAFAAGGLDWVAGVYLGAALALYRGARRIRPPRQRFVFARR